MVIVKQVIVALCVTLILAVAPARAQAPAASSTAPTAPGVNVSGRIVDAYPGALPQPDAVLLRRMDGQPVMTSSKAAVRPDRTFVIENVAPGTYEIQASYSFDFKTITVATSDVRDLEVVVSGQTRLNVTVRMDDGSPVPPGATRRVVMGPDRSLTGSLDGPAPLTLPPGQHQLFVSPPAGVYVQAITSRNVDLLRNPVEVKPGDAPRAIEVVLTRTRPAGAPRASIVGTTGQPGVEIELVNVTDFNRMRIAGTMSTDEAGSFRFSNLDPGIYRINIPPAVRVVEGLEVGGGEVRVDIPFPAGARIVAGAAVPIHDAGKRFILVRSARLDLVAERDGERTRIPIKFIGYWGALAPGAYRLTVDGLERGFTVRSLTAGSVNLLEQPFVVPVDRPAETVRLELTYTPPE